VTLGVSLDNTLPQELMRQRKVAWFLIDQRDGGSTRVDKFDGSSHLGPEIWDPSRIDLASIHLVTFPEQLALSKM
jgi:hypothetical protein